MPSAREETSTKIIAETHNFLKRHSEGIEADVELPPARNLIVLLESQAGPNRGRLSELISGTSHLDDWLDAFSKSELLQAADICVKGVRKELCMTTDQTEYGHISFAEALAIVLTDSKLKLRPQICDLPMDQKRYLCNRLEQLAAENERKASEIITQMSPFMKRDVELVFGLLTDSSRLREAAVALEACKSQS